MAGESADPTVVRSIAVTAEDVLTAIEANRTSGRHTVLRLTPPFSGRMRARLHVPQAAAPDDSGEPRPIHVDPESLLDEEAPPFPHPDDTEAALRSDPDASYSVDRHRDRHVRAVAGWRRAARRHFVDSVRLPTGPSTRDVDVTVLG